MARIRLQKEVRQSLLFVMVFGFPSIRNMKVISFHLTIHNAAK